MTYSVRHFSCNNSYLSAVTTCSEHYVVCAVKQNGNLAVWNIELHEKEPVMLIGHHMSVTALSLSNNEDHLLCSCSSDNTILWDLLQNGGHPNKGRVLLSNLNTPSACCFSRDNTRVIINCNIEIIVLNLSDRKFSLISAQTYPISSVLPGWNTILVALSDSNFLKVWDLANNDTIHQKLISSGIPLALAIDIESRHIAVGTSSGNIFVFAENFALIRTWRVWKLLKDYMSIRQSLDNTSELSPEFENDDDFHILDLSIFTFKQNDSEINGHFPCTLGLLVITSSCLFIMNVNREKMCFFLDFCDSVSNGCHFGLIGSTTIRPTSNNNDIVVALSPLAVNNIILLTLCLRNICNSQVSVYEAVETLHINETSQDASECLSFISSKTIYCSSYLNFKKFKVVQKESVYKNSTNGHFSRQSKPTTLHSKVKSSGYGTLYSSTMFQPTKTKKLSSSVPKRCGGLSRFSKSNDILCVQKLELLSELCINESSGILSTKISVDGQHALCASNNGIVELLKLRQQNMKIVKSVSCHKNVVNCINWSHSGQFWLTSSSDRTAKLWSSFVRNQDPLLEFTSPKINKKSSFTQYSSKENHTFEDDITRVQFYFIDEFVLLSSKNILYMYRYNIQNQETDQRCLTQNRSKMVVRVPLSCQRITTFAAVNQFYSNLVICAGSSKCLDVLDMNTAKVIWTDKGVSDKPPYIICLNEGSASLEQASYMYDVFLTASLGEGIKLWDLRSKKSVINYYEHCCRTVKCGVSFSPCGRYIAVGSEDKSIFIYDLRSTSSLCKLVNDRSDVITDVAFSPNAAQLLASSLNGLVYLYGNA